MKHSIPRREDAAGSQALLRGVAEAVRTAGKLLGVRLSSRRKPPPAVEQQNAYVGRTWGVKFCQE